MSQVSPLQHPFLIKLLTYIMKQMGPYTCDSVTRSPSYSTFDLADDVAKQAEAKDLLCTKYNTQSGVLKLK